MTTTRYPLPTAERRSIVQKLSDYARGLEAEADDRRGLGSWNGVVRDELRRAAGAVRLVATLVLNGSMSMRKAKFWLKATDDYVRLVRRADRRGVIR